LFALQLFALMGPQHSAHDAVQPLEFLFPTQCFRQLAAAIPELIESVLTTNRKKLVELSLKSWLGKNSLADTAAAR
jgi:hypothetical protein